MSYNMSFMDNSSTLTEIVSNVNGTANGIPAVAILVTVFIVSFVAFNTFDKVQAMIMSSYITSILAAFFWFMGLVAWWIAVIPMVVLLAAYIIHYFGS